MDSEIIKKTQKLAKLVLTKQRFQKIHSNIKEILEYINVLSSLDTSNLDITYNASELNNVASKDEPDTSIMLTQEQATKNAAESKEGYIVVPKVIKG